MLNLAYLHNHKVDDPWSDEFVEQLKPLCVTPFLDGRQNQNTTGQLLRQDKPFTTWLLHFSFSISPVVFHKKTLEFLHKPSLVYNGTLLIPAWTRCSCGNPRYWSGIWCPPREFSRRQKQAELAEPGKTFSPPKSNRPQSATLQNHLHLTAPANNLGHRKCNREQTLLKEPKDESECHLTRMPKRCRCFSCLVFTALWESSQCTIDCSVPK